MRAKPDRKLWPDWLYFRHKYRSGYCREVGYFRCFTMPSYAIQRFDKFEFCIHTIISDPPLVVVRCEITN